MRVAGSDKVMSNASSSAPQRRRAIDWPAVASTLSQDGRSVTNGVFDIRGAPGPAQRQRHGQRTQWPAAASTSRPPAERT